MAFILMLLACLSEIACFLQSNFVYIWNEMDPDFRDRQGKYTSKDEWFYLELHRYELNMSNLDNL